jgi:hypothetical protein
MTVQKPVENQPNTEFFCKICKEPVVFNITDSSTFINKTPQKRFFGMQLTTYRVSHNKEQTRHINTVLVDHKGLFRGHVDAYTEEAQKETIPVRTKEFSFIMDKEIQTITDDPNIGVFMVLNRNERWLMEIINPGMNILELLRMVMQRYDEYEKIYGELAEIMKINVADKELYAINGKHLSAVIGYKGIDPTAKSTIDAVITNLFTKYEKEGKVPQKKTFNFLIKIIKNKQKYKEKDIEYITRLLTDDLLYTNIRTKYEDRIYRIITRVTKDFPIAETILIPLLTGKFSVIQLLNINEDVLERYDELLDMIDFINRRKIFD